jgi:hypothetical protein
MYSFIDVMIDCWNYVRSVALIGAAFNPSWHLTAVDAVSSAVAVHAASRRWLSFFVRPRRREAIKNELEKGTKSV